MNDRDFQPTATFPILKERAALLKKLRQFFEERNFLEVETPLLSADTVVEQHIDPVSVLLPHDPRQPERGQPMWLQSSPEFHMKRLLATGEYEAIFQISKAFRVAERGQLHNPEFTIVEWYRVGDDLAAGMDLLCDLCVTMLGTPPVERLTYREAFLRYAEFDPFADEASGAIGDERKHNEDLNELLATKVEPQLGRDRPTLLYHYPASQAALSQVTTDSHGNAVAERFELYVDGIELANGYHELLDADELRQRNAKNNVIRLADGRVKLPEESRLLTAMEHGLPNCTGVALGFDRLVMLATGAANIEEVIAFPIERA
mgnify:CR=1 FL=1